MESTIKLVVTAGNIDAIREKISALDQREAVEVGDTISHYPFLYQPGDQRGDLTVYHNSGRAAICFGGDSDWGEWDGDAEAICVSELEDMWEDGRMVSREVERRYDTDGDEVTNA